MSNIFNPGGGGSDPMKGNSQGPHLHFGLK